jgi:hypothetical protein
VYVSSRHSNKYTNHLNDRYKPLQATSSAEGPLPPLPARPSADNSSLQLLSSTAGDSTDASSTDSSALAGVVSGGSTSSNITASAGDVQPHSIEGVQSPTSSEAKNATKREKVRTLVVSHSVY